MNNAIARFGKTCVSMLVGGGLMAAGLFAAPDNMVTVSLPHAVTVGGTTLPVGEYTISTLKIGSSVDDLFLIRSEDGKTVATMQAQRVLLGSQSEKTQVVLSRDGDQWNFGTLVIAGDGVSYQFTK